MDEMNFGGIYIVGGIISLITLFLSGIERFKNIQYSFPGYRYVSDFVAAYYSFML